MKSFSMSVLSGVIAVLLLAAPVNVQSASTSNEPIDPAGVQLEPLQQNGISYVAGGIGLDESRAIQQAKGYNLHMTFSVGSGNEYTSDVDVLILNPQGHQLLSLSGVGPIVFVQLPAGKFQIITTRKGLEQRSMVDMGVASMRDLNIHWNNGY